MAAAVENTAPVPVLTAWLDYDEGEVLAWCGHCSRFHRHGADDPATAGGRRGAHCRCSRSPSFAGEYELAVVGEITPEVLAGHIESDGCVCPDDLQLRETKAVVRRVGHWLSNEALATLTDQIEQKRAGIDPCGHGRLCPDCGLCARRGIKAVPCDAHAAEYAAVWGCPDCQWCQGCQDTHGGPGMALCRTHGVVRGHVHTNAAGCWRCACHDQAICGPAHDVIHYWPAEGEEAHLHVHCPQCWAVECRWVLWATEFWDFMEPWRAQRPYVHTMVRHRPGCLECNQALTAEQLTEIGDVVGGYPMPETDRPTPHEAWYQQYGLPTPFTIWDKQIQGLVLGELGRPVRYGDLVRFGKTEVSA